MHRLLVAATLGLGALIAAPDDAAAQHVEISFSTGGHHDHHHDHDIEAHYDGCSHWEHLAAARRAEIRARRAAAARARARAHRHHRAHVPVRYVPARHAYVPARRAYVPRGRDAYVPRGRDAYVPRGGDAYVPRGKGRYVPRTAKRPAPPRHASRGHGRRHR